LECGVPAGRREARPVDLAEGARGSRGVDRYVRRLTARGLVGLATGLLRMLERAYRAGYLDLAQVEYSVRVSAKLRGGVCRLVGTKARDAPSASAVGRVSSTLAPTRPV
jgi:hypothetical protein